MKVRITQDMSIWGLQTPLFKAGTILVLTEPFRVSPNATPSNNLYYATDGVLIDITSPYCEVISESEQVSKSLSTLKVETDRKAMVEKALSRTGVYINDSYWIVQDGERILKLTINEFNELQRTGRIHRDMKTSTYDVMPF